MTDVDERTHTHHRLEETLSIGRGGFSLACNELGGVDVMCCWLLSSNEEGGPSRRLSVAVALLLWP